MKDESNATSEAEDKCRSKSKRYCQINCWHLNSSYTYFTDRRGTDYRQCQKKRLLSWTIPIFQPKHIVPLGRLILFSLNFSE